MQNIAVAVWDLLHLIKHKYEIHTYTYVLHFHISFHCILMLHCNSEMNMRCIVI